MTVSGQRRAQQRTEQSEAAGAKRGFADTATWIFDLDNTLYPAQCNLFAEVDRRMGTFIAEFLDVPFEHARYLKKTYYRQFGTTLTGLMQVHKLEPQSFLDYVHDIDLSPVPQLPELAAAVEALPGRRLIFTNGSRHHAERVAEKLGLDMTKIKADMASPEVKAEVDKSEALAKKMGVNGTPHFLIGDRAIAGAPEDLYDQLAKNVGELRKQGCSYC